MRAFAALVLLAGCGPAPVDFAGTYEGPLTQSGTCNVPSPFAWQLKIVQDSKGLRIEPFAGCASVPLEASGATAKLRPVACPARSSDPSAEAKGEFTLEGSKLKTQMDLLVGFPSCTLVASGSLLKK